MTWALLYHGAVVETGSYMAVIEAAEEAGVLERCPFYGGCADRTRFTVRGYALVPAAMVGVRRGR